jgi:tetratricopeptide (TPR) repeat protein
MRLLHVDELGEFILTDFSGKTIPPYAILSHRWGSSEILFKDVMDRIYREKEDGYRKLEFCAKQAAQDNLQYFWIDTCCIDKWNLSELSKSINSMFQWYMNAKRCYVFLPDISVSTATDPVQRSDWEASFRASAWFTRGWTLQELIAPVSVEFFSCEGRLIGDKVSLGQLIHEITDIPLAALHNCPMGQFTTLERERWAERRTTTEEEDIVYCLLGILGVSMPADYGEKQDSARRRLQTEIESVGSAPSIIPFSRNHRFVGQESHLAKLEAKLFSNEQTTTTLAIVGLGGTGKSQLALEVAHRTRQNNKHCSVFWIDASNQDSLYQSYASVAQKLGVAGWDDDQIDMKQLARRCVAEISARQCLLIFDNVGDTSLSSSGSSTAEATDLTDYLPCSHLCSVIFTTTSSNTAKTLAPQCSVALQELTPDTAQDMLQNHLARPLSNAEQQEADYLLRELSYLPLAITQAAACMKASDMTVQEYLSQLDKHTDVALENSSSSSDSQLQSSGVRNPVAATLFLSIDQIGGDNSFAADCLYFAACVDRKDISLDLIEAASPQARQDAVRLLEKYALVTRRPGESAIDLHQLVHQALRNRLHVQGRLEQWTQRTITQLLRVYPYKDHSNRSKWRRLLPHAQYALSHSPADDDNQERLRLTWRYAETLESDGQYEKAGDLLMQVLQTLQRLFGDQHPGNEHLVNEDPGMLDNMNGLALMYHKQGKLREAEELQLQVTQGMKRVLGNEHPSTLISMDNLALTYSDQGRWEEAEDLQVQVMQARERVLGDNHPDLLTSMVNLALTYNNQGRWKEAEELQVRAIQTMERMFSDYTHPHMLTGMSNLSLTYFDQDRLKEAEELQLQVMQTRKRVLGNKHPDVLTSMNNLAATYGQQGRWEEAEELQVQALQTMKTVLGNKHPVALINMQNLALTLHSQARHEEALGLLETCFQSRQEVIGDKHPDTLIVMHNLAVALHLQARREEALGLMEACFQLCQQVLGEQDRTTQSSLDELNKWRAELSKGDSSRCKSRTILYYITLLTFYRHIERAQRLQNSDHKLVYT